MRLQHTTKILIELDSMADLLQVLLPADQNTFTEHIQLYVDQT